MSPRDASKKTGRRALPIILIVLATIVGVTSVFGLWAKRQLLETETWNTTSEQLIQNPDVQAALSTFIVSAIYDNVDVEAELADRLPPRMRVVFSPSVDDAKSGGER